MRPPGWEARLQAVLVEAQTRQFHPREWNCAIFCATAVEAITGLSMPRRLSGTLEQTVDAIFPRTERVLARSGDVVLANLPEPTVGVCTGAKAAFLGVSGLEAVPMSEVITVWKV